MGHTTASRVRLFSLLWGMLKGGRAGIGGGGGRTSGTGVHDVNLTKNK